MSRPLHVLTPRFILQQAAAGRPSGRFQAATLFVDISGFTAVTERLMQHGKQGAEQLATVMADIFTPLIAAVYEGGGFVVGFAGDAFTAVFPGRGVRAKARAVAAAAAMQQALARFAHHPTPLGAFAFTGRVGIAAGGVSWGILGSDQQRVPYFRGQAIDACATAEHAANDGEIVLTRDVADPLSNTIQTTPKSSQLLQLIQITSPLPLGKPPSFATPLEADGDLTKAAVHFQPPALLEMAVQGEFRQVVSLFINLQGNPRPAALARFMAQTLRLLEQYGGYLCRLDFGDKGCNLLCFWGAPVSHENDIARALNFVLDLRASTSLTLRAGVTYRQAFAGFAGSSLREEYTCYGLSINQSARQMMTAPWGEIWLDEALAQQATRFATASVGAFPFKGFSEPQPVFRLVGRQEAATPYYRGAFAGRESELATLAAAARPLANGRFAGVVLVSGEAGIGKSRLVDHFLQQRLLDGVLPQRFVCQTDEILRRPFNPFRYWLTRYFGQSATADEASNKRAFAAKLDDLIEATADEAQQAELNRVRSVLGALVDLSWPDSLYAQLTPELRLENSYIAVKRLLLAEAARQPTILLVEDAQWLDEASRELLRRLPRNVADTPLLLLLTSREAGVDELFAGETAIAHLALDTLTPDKIGEIAQAFLGEPPAAPLLTLLTQRAEGNPFFLEQLLLFLREQGLLEKTAAGVTVSSEQGLLPQTVQAVLVARLDRLAGEVRRVVQTAAVLGREFEVQVLSAMLRHEAGVHERVLLAEKAAVWAPLSELTYLFRHALLRDAAYEMQLQSHLQALHLGAARALEALHGTSAAYAEPIGYHFEQAGEIGAAVPYWQTAVSVAQENYQNDSALALLDKVLAQAETLPMETVFGLRQQQVKILLLVGQLEEAEAILQAALQQAEAAGDERQTVRLLNQLGELHHYQGNFAAVEAVMLRSLVLAQKLGDLGALTAVYRELGNAQEGFGNYAQATRYYEQGLAICEQLGDVGGAAQATLNLGLMIWNQGDYDAAERLYLEALAGFEQTQDPYSQGKVFNNLGSVAVGRRDYDKAKRYYQQAYELFQEMGSYLGQSITLGNLGAVASNAAPTQESIDYYERALAISVEANDLYGVAYEKHNLAWNYYAGNRAKGIATLREALTLALEIQAVMIVLECFNVAADFLAEEDQRQSYRLVAFVRNHPAHHAEMLDRLQQVADKLRLTEEEKAGVETAVANLSLEALANELLNRFAPFSGLT